jgi:perosamine synthetase
VGAPHAVAVNSCTSALHLALAIAGVGPRDEVITTAQTFAATAHVVLAQGATPVFADVQYGTGNIDPSDIERRVTPRTKAVLPVHWAGYPCDMDEIQAIAARHGLAVIEDAAHALGASYRSRPIGSLSRFTCFSFQAIKHFTPGDGGMLCVPDEPDYWAAARRRWFGIDRVHRKPALLGEPEWNITEIGYKYHMNDLAAAMGLGNLEDLDLILTRRAEIAARYRRELGGVPGVTLLESRPDRQSANWLFTIHVERRDDFVRMMQSKEIEVSVVHLRIDRNDIFGGERKDLPALARFTESCISIPVHCALSDDDVGRIVDAVKGGW